MLTLDKEIIGLFRFLEVAFWQGSGLFCIVVGNSVLTKTVARKISAIASKNWAILTVNQVYKFASSGVSIPVMTGSTGDTGLGWI